MTLDLSTDDRRLATRPQQRLLLWLGLGGLLVLLVTLGVSSMSFLKEVERRHEGVRADFIARFRVLEQLRNDLYRSGTRVHDYLLATDAGTVDGSRADVLASRERIEALEREYARALRPEERELFAALRREVDVYFGAMLPVLQWSDAQRLREVDVFVRDEMHPRRNVLLHIADEIEALNAQDMERNAADAAALFVRYRRLLLLLVISTVAIGAGLAMFSMARITRLERESDRRVRQVEHARLELQALSGKLVDAQEAERRKLSRELHDEIGQGLWAIVLGLGNATAALDDRQLDEARTQLASARRLTDGMVRTVRNLALLLRPSVLDDLGLIPALNWLAREVGRAGDLRVEVSSCGALEGLREDQRTCIYRVIQEALHNCQRHAGATVARVAVEEEGGTLHLTVSDDGRGLQPSNDRGLGILGMEERVVHLGGTFRMRSAAGAGTVVDVLLPLRGGAAGELPAGAGQPLPA